MKRLVIFLLCMSLVFPCISVSAEEVKPEVVLNVSEADADGIITVDAVVYNAALHGAHVVFSFNTNAVQAMNGIEIGEMITLADGEDEFNIFSAIKRSADNEKGLVSVAVMSDVGQPVPNEKTDENFVINADSNGVKIFSIKFKVINGDEHRINFAKEGDAVYEDAVPDGIALSLSGESIETNAVVKYAEKEVSHATVTVPAPVKPAKTEEQLRKERVKDSLILQIDNYAAVDDGALCWIDDANKAVMPYIKNDRTMVPLRFVAERLGLTVEWKGETQEIVMTGAGTNLVMQIGNKTYTKNGTELSMEAAPELTADDRTFVPLRAIAEAFGQSVHWIESQKCVIIVPGNNPWNEKGKVEQRLMQDALLIMSPLIRDMN